MPNTHVRGCILEELLVLMEQAIQRAKYFRFYIYLISSYTIHYTFLVWVWVCETMGLLAQSSFVGENGRYINKGNVNSCTPSISSVQTLCSRHSQAQELYMQLKTTYIWNKSKRKYNIFKKYVSCLRLKYFRKFNH